MKIKIRTQLIFAYLLIIILLIVSLLFVSNYFLDKQFETYMTQKQEMKSQEITSFISRNYHRSGRPPSKEFFDSYGQTLLQQGIVLKIYSPEGEQEYCSHMDSHSGHMMMAGESCGGQMGYDNLSEYIGEDYILPEGEYSEISYPVEGQSGKNLGTITLGYYGPFYYNAADNNFINQWSKTFILTGATLAIAAVIIALIIAENFAKPILAISKQSDEIVKGDYKNKINVKTSILELDYLANNIDILADTLQTQSEEKKRLMDDYSHELKTPISALQATLEAMIDGLIEPNQSVLETLHEEILRMARMSDQIDNLGEISNVSRPIEKTNFNLTNLVKSTANMFMAQANNKSVEIITPENKVELFADYDYISQLLINIISNGVKYTKENGRLEIELDNRDNNVIIKVMDNGVGINPEELPFIFDSFYRTDKSRNGTTGGRGIGLSVAKSIVERHQGEIMAESHWGKGTTFTITLPEK